MNVIYNAGLNLKADRRRKSPPVTCTVILPAILECVHMHIYCMKVNMAGFFPEYNVCTVRHPQEKMGLVSLAGRKGRFAHQDLITRVSIQILSYQFLYIYCC